MIDNKFLFAVAGLVIGYYIAKKRITKNEQVAADKAVDEAAKIFDDMLLKAQNAGLSIPQVREQLAKP